MAVVDALEVIQVDEEECQIDSSFPTVFNGPAESDVEIAVVVEAGEIVPLGDLLRQPTVDSWTEIIPEGDPSIDAFTAAGGWGSFTQEAGERVTVAVKWGEVKVKTLGLDVDGLGSMLQAIESAAQDVIFLGVAIFFLLTIEGRLKRRVALRDLRQLRAVVHIVDMHQLTKDPEHLLAPAMRTPSSPERQFTRFELSRYLDYCTELLSLSSKLAALHAAGAVRTLEIQL